MFPAAQGDILGHKQGSLFLALKDIAQNTWFETVCDDSRGATEGHFPAGLDLGSHPPDP